MQGGFLMFGPVDSGGGFLGEGMFYAGALQLIGASVLAAGLLAWCVAFLVIRPLLPASNMPYALIAMVWSGGGAPPFLILFFRNKNLIDLGIFALLWVVLLPGRGAPCRNSFRN